MSRTSALVVGAALVLALGTFLALSRGASAEGNDRHRIAYVYVSGIGPQAKAWYDGGAPSGVQVQAALDRFSADGYQFRAISSSGRPPLALVGPNAPTIRSEDVPADYVILLER